MARLGQRPAPSRAARQQPGQYGSERRAEEWTPSADGFHEMWKLNPAAFRVVNAQNPPRPAQHGCIKLRKPAAGLIELSTFEPEPLGKLKPIRQPAERLHFSARHLFAFSGCVCPETEPLAQAMRA